MESVTVLLGAGFSQALAILGTAAISEIVDDELKPFGRPFIALKQRLATRFGQKYNFEVLAAALEVCGAYEPPSFMPTPPYHSVIPDVAALRNGLDSKITSIMYEHLMQLVMKAVTVDWRASIDNEVVTRVEDTVDRLRSTFVLDIATLNYDQGAEHFVPDAIDGFSGSDGPLEFDPRIFLHEGASKIAHLHGSSLFAFPETRNIIMKMREQAREYLSFCKRSLDTVLTAGNRSAPSCG